MQIRIENHQQVHLQVDVTTGLQLSDPGRRLVRQPMAGRRFDKRLYNFCYMLRHVAWKNSSRSLVIESGVARRDIRHRMIERFRIKELIH